MTAQCDIMFLRANGCPSRHTLSNLEGRHVGLGTHHGGTHHGGTHLGVTVDLSLGHGGDLGSLNGAGLLLLFPLGEVPLVLLDLRVVLLDLRVVLGPILLALLLAPLVGNGLVGWTPQGRVSELWVWGFGSDAPYCLRRYKASRRCAATQGGAPRGC